MEVEEFATASMGKEGDLMRSSVAASASGGGKN